MKKHVYTERGDVFLRAVEADPVCGEDFCDSCGDCLACNGGDPCYESRDGEHLWVQYGDGEKEDEEAGDA